MIIIPTLCASCGTLFSSRTFEEAHLLLGLEIVGHQEPCPKCAGFANNVDGTFIKAIDGAIEFLPSPQVSTDLLEAFADLLQKAVRKQVSGDELEGLANGLDETLGTFVRRFRSPFHNRSLLCMLLWVKGSKCSLSLRMQVNQMLQQIRSRSEAKTPSLVTAPAGSIRAN